MAIVYSQFFEESRDRSKKSPDYLQLNIANDSWPGARRLARDRRDQENPVPRSKRLHNLEKTLSIWHTRSARQCRSQRLLECKHLCESEPQH